MVASFLAGSPSGICKTLGFEARRAQRTQQFAPKRRRTGGTVTTKSLLACGSKFGEQSPSARQEAVFNARLVGTRRDVDGDLRHGIP